MQGEAARFIQAKQYWKGLVVITFLLILFAWLLNTPPGILGKADAIGYAVCHRIDLRSFHMGEIQLPLCARCSGMYLGAMVGLIYQWVIGLVPAFNATAWKMSDPRPAFINFRSFFFMVLIALGLNALILLENPVILYPLSLISVAGVLVLLTLVYSMVLIMLFKAENKYNQLNQLAFAVLGGLTIALIQVGLLDIIRYFFTGTWDGFHI
jgi:membrane-associated HD superfamily phosphohydrolase